jgi:hypothetical protein
MRVAHPVGVVDELRGKPSRPEPHRTRHCLLHVRVAGQGDLALLDGERLERRGYRMRTVGEFLDRIAQVQAQRREHLIVARTAGMQARAGLAHLASEQGLECGLSVLELERHGPVAARMPGSDFLEPSGDGGEIRVVQETGVVQHPGVRDGGAHVVGDETVVEGVVLAGRVVEHPLIERCALVPESSHRSLLRVAPPTSSPVPRP